MFKKLLIGILGLVSAVAVAQPPYSYSPFKQVYTDPPSLACSAVVNKGVFAKSTTNVLYLCSNNNITATYEWDALGASFTLTANVMPIATSTHTLGDGPIDYNITAPNFYAFVAHKDADTGIQIGAGTLGITLDTEANDIVTGTGNGPIALYAGSYGTFDANTGLALSANLGQLYLSSNDAADDAAIQIQGLTAKAISIDQNSTGPINIAANDINHYFQNTYGIKQGASTFIFDWGKTASDTFTINAGVDGSSALNLKSSTSMSLYTAGGAGTFSFSADTFFNTHSFTLNSGDPTIAFILAMHCGGSPTTATVANYIGIQMPGSCTMYNLTLPTGPPSSSNSTMTCTNSGGNVTCAWTAPGSNTVYRCLTAGATLPAGSLTTNSAACGTSTDSGLKSN